jgi:SMP-30/Gluconolactonase/LRE-like region
MKFNFMKRMVIASVSWAELQMRVPRLISVCRRMTGRGIAMETSNSTASRKLNGATKTFLLPLIAAITLCAFLTNIIWTHPGSGIVVGQKGQVFFIDTGNPDVRFSGCIWKIDVQGKLTCFFPTGAHWLALDANGDFARADFKKWFDQRITPNFERVPLSDPKSALIQTDGAPFVVGQDGYLYYANGHLEIVRLSPDGRMTLLAPNLKEMTNKLGGIKGLASGPDGSLYATCPSAVLKIKLDGTVTTLIHPIVLKDCDKDLPPETPESQKPYLRGLAVDRRGTVYTAATGCRCVLKITPDGQVKTILTAERPWSPTGIAVFGDDVYVLEYTNANGARKEGWLPRVRKLGRDGKVTMLVTISKEERERRPR